MVTSNVAASIPTQGQYQHIDLLKLSQDIDLSWHVRKDPWMAAIISSLDQYNGYGGL